MTLTPSTMVDLGTPCPDFTLPDFGVDGGGGTRTVARDDLAEAPALVVMFICNHCPYVKHLNQALAGFGRDARAMGAAVVAISSNDVETHPDDAPELMTAEAAGHDYPFPYLYDESQAVARAFRAACTPDFFVYGRDRTLVYRGQFDASRPGNNEPATGADLRAAVEAATKGEPAPAEQVPSVGCNIKWK